MSPLDVFHTCCGPPLGVNQERYEFVTIAIAVGCLASCLLLANRPLKVCQVLKVFKLLQMGDDRASKASAASSVASAAPSEAKKAAAPKAEAAKADDTKSVKSTKSTKSSKSKKDEKALDEEEVDERLEFILSYFTKSYRLKQEKWTKMMAADENKVTPRCQSVSNYFCIVENDFEIFGQPEREVLDHDYHLCRTIDTIY